MQNTYYSTLVTLVVIGILVSTASVSGQHPLKMDTDGDGMPDGWEVEYGLNPDDAGDASLDYNFNGLINLEEYKENYDPRDKDTDDDQLSNYAESRGLFGFFTDPLMNDTDCDNVTDLQELCWYIDTTDVTQRNELYPNETNRENVTFEIFNLRAVYHYKSDPTNPDTDYDGLSDGDEYALGANPSAVDSDFDGLRDGNEVHVYKTNVTLRDSDLDGLSDFEEVFGTYGFVTDPNNNDTDGDCVSDGEECLGFGLVPIPPSKYALSYEHFIRGGGYVNKNITLKARIAKIKPGNEQTNYSLILKSPEYDVMYGGTGIARVESTWHYDLEDGLTHVDDRFGLSLREGDTIIIVGKAKELVGSTREIEVDSEGKLYLVLTPEEASVRWLSSMEFIKLLAPPKTNQTSPPVTVPTLSTAPIPLPESSPIPTATPSSLALNETKEESTATETAPIATPESEDNRVKGLIGLLGYAAIGIALVALAMFFTYSQFGKRIRSRKGQKEGVDRDNAHQSIMEALQERIKRCIKGRKEQREDVDTALQPTVTVMQKKRTRKEWY